MQALDRLPVGAAAITLVGEPCGPQWALHRDSHLGAMATVRRHAFTNDQWAIEGANLLSVTYRSAAPFVADPSQMVKPNGCGNRERMEVDRALGRIPRGAVTHLWAIGLPPRLGEAQRRAQETAALAAMAREISVNLDLDSLLPGIAKRAMNLLEASASAVFLPGSDGETFEAVASVGDYAEEIRASPVKLGDGIIGSLMGTGEAVTIRYTGRVVARRQRPGWVSCAPPQRY